MEWEEVNGVHTPSNPYCDDPDCWCHTNLDYHDLATSPYSTDEDVENAYTFCEIARQEVR